MKKCVWCNRELKEAPTNLWHISKTATEGICHECILMLARMVLGSLEKETIQLQTASQPAVEADAKKTTGACSRCGMSREIHRCYNSDKSTA